MKPDPLLKDALPLPPVATRSFGTHDTLHVLAEIYDRSTKAAHDLDITASIREAAAGTTVFSRTESRRVVAGQDARTERHRLDIPLRELKAGSYVLRVEAAARDGDRRAVREVPFSVHGATPRTTH